MTVEEWERAFRAADRSQFVELLKQARSRDERILALRGLIRSTYAIGSSRT